MTLAVALRLGRVSNLPTVWTNALAGLVLAGAGGGEIGSLAFPLMLAVSLFYVGGMYLNDAFDAEFDRAGRPERPIPSGAVARETVFMAGFAMLGAGLAILLAIGLYWPGTHPLAPFLGGLALGGAILAYDRHHKANPWSPVLMGLCRMLVYVTAALCVATLPPLPVLLGAASLLAYLIGLTYAAKQEHLGRLDGVWPLAFLALPLVTGLVLAAGDLVALAFALAFSLWVLFALRLLLRRGSGDIPRGVVSLIAGISLLDAVLIAGMGAYALAILAVLAFALTLALQRLVPGT